MRSWKQKAGLIGAVVLLAAQLVPVDRSNPAVEPSKSIYATATVPENVHFILQNSCNNCHSNETQWPWYSYIAPGSWIVAHDVHQARKKLNLSEWNSYPPKKKQHKLESICEQVMNQDMPDSKYLLLHRKAGLNQEQRETLCAWTQSIPE